MKLLKQKTHYIFTFLFFFIVSAGVIGGEKVQAMNTRFHTQDEIRRFVADNPAEVKDSLVYLRNPYLETPYETGMLSNATQQSAVNLLNHIRYIAGLSADVKLSDKYSQYAQAAAFISYLNGNISSNPDRPKDMNNTMYMTALEGATHSLLSWASWGECGLNETILRSWMGDGEGYGYGNRADISTMEYRRWLLNPQLGQIGFGAATGIRGTFSAAYVYDESNRTAKETGIAWPARNMPVEYFSSNSPWTFSLGQTVNENNIHVTLTRLSDYKKWQFSSTSADGEFFVNNNYYGQSGCIIFRPAMQGENYRTGDAFQVSITGAGQPIQYNVQFFSMNTARITYTVYFDSQGGSEVAPVVVHELETISPLPMVTKENAEFLGWYTAPNGQGIRLTDTTIINQNIRYYAYWGERDTLTGLTVNYEGLKEAGVDVSRGLVVYANYADGSSKRIYDYTVSPKTLGTGYNLVKVSYNGMEKSLLVTVGDASNSVNDNKVVYYDLYFHPNGGTNLNYQKITIATGDILDELPTVQKANYIFKGWYTKPSGGTRISRTSLPESECVLYAQWTRVTKPARVSDLTLESQKKGQIRVSYQAIAGTKGYEIAYADNKDFQSQKKTSSVYAAKTIKNLKQGKTYYVRVRAYKTDSTGRKIYGAYSEKKRIDL